jgi:hypothetical protein
MAGTCSASPATNHPERTAVARTLLIRGMLVGLVAGIVAFLVARLLGEGPVNAAIGFETAHDTAMPSAMPGMQGPELVSRGVQSTIGLATGVVLFAVAMGGLFALAYACVQGRLGRLDARATAALMALAGFTVVYLLPSLKYPANPPSIGNPDTIGRRTALYFTAMVIAAVVVVACGIAGRRLSRRLGGWDAALTAGAAGVAAVTVAYLALPAVHEIPAGFPADTLWWFRLASLAVQATLWATLGLLFGALTHRALHPAIDGRPRERADTASADTASADTASADTAKTVSGG